MTQAIMLRFYGVVQETVVNNGMFIQIYVFVEILNKFQTKINEMKFM